jgi:hypothetical protein
MGGPAAAEPSQRELAAAKCWESDDRVPHRPDTTAFRRRARLHQARWREDHGLPIGTQPFAPKDGDDRWRYVGSRLPLAFARESGANFVTQTALTAARDRMSVVEPHQSIDHQRLWADLLSSQALAFNLFGDAAADPALAERIVRHWFPDAPAGRVTAVRFVHSPGRLDPEYLNSLRDFAVAFVLGLADGSSGVVAVDVRYHERNKPETPKPENRSWYEGVAQRSSAFADDAIDELLGKTDRCEMWLEHLLLLSLLQHRSGEWTWGRYVVVHTGQNPDRVDLLARYRTHLVDDATFATCTLADLLDAGALPGATTKAVRERYVLP